MSAQILRDRFLFPTPRCDIGVALRGLASACIDVSDGLGGDLEKLCAASGCGAEVDAAALPVSESLLAAVGRELAREYALTGGDDYELLFTVPLARLGAMTSAVARGLGPVTRIGSLVAGKGVQSIRTRWCDAVLGVRFRPFRRARRAERVAAPPVIREPGHIRREPAAVFCRHLYMGQLRSGEARAGALHTSSKMSLEATKTGPDSQAQKILENRVPDRIGKYVIINEVGRGSTGTVYLSHDSYYGRDVAIKVYNMDQDPSDERAKIARKMFLSEAHMVGMLQHPHILPIYDAGEENGRCYIVTEHVHGARTLSAYCRPDNLLRVDDVVEIMFKCAKALHYAHTRGVIHRDIKPSNIMLTQDSDVRIIDFGIALVADSEISRIEGIAGRLPTCRPSRCRASSSRTTRICIRSAR